jgi:hypothetical protein
MISWLRQAGHAHLLDDHRIIHHKQHQYLLHRLFLVVVLAVMILYSIVFIDQDHFLNQISLQHPLMVVIILVHYPLQPIILLLHPLVLNRVLYILIHLRLSFWDLI